MNPSNLQALLTAYSVFLEEVVYPEELSIIYGHFKEHLPKLQRMREEARRRGLFNPHLPESSGGLGLRLSEFAEVSALLGKSPLGHYLCNCQAPDIGNMELLHLFGSESQKRQFLHPLERGEIRSCFSMTEPEHAGSNPVHLSTRAVRDGDSYRITGHKWFTTAADGAHFTIVMALTNPEAENPYSRASMLLVPLDTPGFELVRNIPIMGDTGSDYFSHAEVRFHDCRVPAAYLIGEEGQGFMLAQERLGPGRIHHCMRWIGIAERALEMMCRYALKRELNPGQPLAQQQSIQNWIAESAAHIRASRLMVLDTARQIEEKGAKEAKEAISTIKFFVSDMLMNTLDRAIQTHGALGITDDTLLSFWYRHERGARIYDGPDEVHKSVLARKLLKSYR
ncbi:putative acyl-CoA dehydrogenase [Nitritalea halalkaliphila LW7]|uniref:Putative acyl-CoA dehydrogenase n=1 Tax=Nitritalea halalkaliphila LW7 TaxID=1189621 RepID=I5CAP1_9BACT|nr:acyl-CoA dehydrogenase family protein [Nitritalea halalkaliphila]EIM78893.1 putative acyl-CoA dehydrogenase [Nitritalea halalkaliphila LW7]